MVLALTFAVLVPALGLVFWGTTRFLQSYLYSQPAENLALRSLIAGLVVAGFLTLWIQVNTKADSENKYGTFFDFNPVGSKEVTAFEAVQRYPRRDEKNREETVKFTRVANSKPPVFVDATGNKYEMRSTSRGYLTVALVLDEGDGQKARFNAAMNPKDPNIYASAGESPNFQFDEQGGSRYLSGEAPITVYSPSRGAVFAALALNALGFIIWFVALWPILRYGSATAMGLALACGAATLLVLMPLLFKLNKPPANSTTAPTSQTGSP